MAEKTSLSPLLSLARQLAVQAAEQAIEKVKTDERLQEARRSLKEGISDLGAELRERAGRAEAESPEAQEKREQRRARQALLLQAQTSTERKVLRALAEKTNWLGGTGKSMRYTVLLDLFQATSAAEEMALHRAIWGLQNVGLFGFLSLEK